MDTTLFAVEARKILYVQPLRRRSVARSRRRKYEHSFGGPPCHDGITQPGFESYPAHLLFRFDLHDPEIGIEIPGLRWLPIYYAWRAGGICYRLVSDSQIERIGESYSEHDFRYGTFDNFPPPFPRVPLSLKASDYDPHDFTDVMTYGKIFGLDDLTPEEKAWIQSRIEEDFRQRFGEDLTGLSGEALESLEDVVDHFAQYYGQGFLDGRCTNEKCANSPTKGQMQGLLVVEPGPEDGPLYP
jgi:hypothetical protein